MAAKKGKYRLSYTFRLWQGAPEHVHVVTFLVGNEVVENVSYCTALSYVIRHTIADALTRDPPEMARIQYRILRVGK